MSNYIGLDDIKAEFAIPDFDRLEFPDGYEHPVIEQQLAFSLAGKGEKVTVHPNHITSVTEEGVQFEPFYQISKDPLAMYIVAATNHIVETTNDFFKSRLTLVKDFIRNEVTLTISAVEVALQTEYKTERQVAYYRFEEIEGIYKANMFHPHWKKDSWRSGVLREIDSQLTFQEFSLPGDMLNCYPVTDPKPVKVDAGRRMKLSIQRALAEESRQASFFKAQTHNEAGLQQTEDNIVSLKRLLGAPEPKPFTPVIMRGIFEIENDEYVLKTIIDAERGLSSPFMSVPYALKAIATYEKYKAGLTPNRCEQVTTATENLLQNTDVRKLTAKEAKQILETIKNLFQETKREHDALPVSSYWPPAGIHSSSMRDIED